MNRFESRSVLGRPWWTHKTYEDGVTRVSLVGYGMRRLRQERRNRMRGVGRAGRGIVGYPRSGR